MDTKTNKGQQDAETGGMFGDDQTQAFLDSLPELKPGDTFVFACNPSVPCFNRCCAELTLPLTPYDVLRLRHNLNMPSEEFLRAYTQMRSFPDTGFPLPMLRMLEGPGEPCPFVTPAGCSLYDDRPGACRTYPLGRGTRMGEGGEVLERFFVVREPHCHGFDTGQEWTAQAWLRDQGLEPYNDANDRYMRLMAMVKASGSPISSRMANMCILSFYQVDTFLQFLQTTPVFDKVDMPEERRAAIMADEFARLDFAYDWVELVLFGQCPALRRKG